MLGATVLITRELIKLVNVKHNSNYSIIFVPGAEDLTSVRG